MIDDRDSMTDTFDATHPSGEILFRSARGGCLYDVTLAHGAMDTDAATLAEAIQRTADVSYLRAAMRVREDIVAAGHTPSAALPTAEDLAVAVAKLNAHELTPRT